MKRGESTDTIEQVTRQNWHLIEALIDCNKRLSDLLDRTLDAATVEKPDQIQRVMSDYESRSETTSATAHVRRMPDPEPPSDPGEITGTWFDPGS